MNGRLTAAHKEQRFLQNTLKAADEFDIEHKMLTDDEVAALFPSLDLDTTDKDHVYYYEPTSGYLRPEKCIQVQLDLAKTSKKQEEASICPQS